MCAEEMGEGGTGQEEARENLRPVRGWMARIDTDVPADVDGGAGPQLRSPITTLKSFLTGGRHPSPYLPTLSPSPSGRVILRPMRFST